MSKIYGFLAAALMTIAAAAPAHAEILIDVNAIEQAAMTEARLTGLNWKVGDKASYKMSGGFINGTAENVVREETNNGFWMVQDMNLGAIGKQKIEILFNKNTGAVEKVLVNGKEEKLPAQGDVEIIETKEARIKVIAGEFDAIYAKVRTKSDNRTQEAWLNPQAVPMSGMLKVIAETQFGKITQELTSFKFAAR